VPPRRARADGARATTGGSALRASERGVAGFQTLIVQDFPSTADAHALSPNGRVHWTTKNAARKSVASEVVIAATQQRLRPVAGPVRLLFRYVFPDRRKRDLDNLTAISKPMTDALVRGRWISADDSEHVVEVKAEAVVEKGRRYLEVTIAPAEQARDGRAGEG
jgi:Holliday junction resolvase RusA-like endonuclease